MRERERERKARRRPEKKNAKNHMCFFFSASLPHLAAGVPPVGFNGDLREGGLRSRKILPLAVPRSSTPFSSSISPGLEGGRREKRKKKNGGGVVQFLT